MEMCYSGALVMPSSYALMDEDEMMYLEGGARYYDIRGLFSLIIGTVQGAASVTRAVKILATITEVAVKNILYTYMGGCAGFLSLLWYATQITTAFIYLDKYGTYYVDSLSVWDVGIANYVRR